MHMEKKPVKLWEWSLAFATHLEMLANIHSCETDPYQAFPTDSFGFCCGFGVFFLSNYSVYSYVIIELIERTHACLALTSMRNVFSKFVPTFATLLQTSMTILLWDLSLRQDYATF